MDVLVVDSRRGRVHWSVRSIALQTVSVWSATYTVYPLYTMQKIGVWEWVVIYTVTWIDLQLDLSILNGDVLNLISVQAAPHLPSPYLDHLYLHHYKPPSAPLDHLTCGMSYLLHSVNLILFTLLLINLILRISQSPRHSHHLRSHHLSLPCSGLSVRVPWCQKLQMTFGLTQSGTAQDAL